MVSLTNLLPSKKASTKAPKKNIKDSVPSSGDFKEQSLSSHNDCRKKHNVQPLKWSETLAKNAQNWANHLGKHGKLEHAHINQRKGEGENIFCSGGQELDGSSATMAWYNEIKDYDFTCKPKYNPKCGHFTQVVWADSTELGVGRSKAKNGMDFVVARYSPMGNDLNGFEDNIKPPVTTDAPTDHAKECQEPDPETKDDKEEDNSIHAVNKDDPLHKTCKHFEGSDVSDDGKESEDRKEEKPIPEEVTPTTSFCQLQVLKKDIADETPSSTACRTVEVINLLEPIDCPCYLQRKDSYLQAGKSYILIHGFYS